MTRPRLQLHLSTLLIVTVLAAGLVWMNVAPQIAYTTGSYGQSRPSCRCEFYGWPRKWLTREVTISGNDYPGNWNNFKLSDLDALVFDEKYETEWISDDQGGNRLNAWQKRQLAIDIVIALSILAVTAAAIEWATRRMKRKPTL
jgi:hypothetical protein